MKIKHQTRKEYHPLTRIFTILLITLCSTAFFSAPVWAGTTDTVAATVTARNISVSITSSKSISYGTVDLSSTADTTGAGPAPGGETQTAENDGNVAEDFNITSTHATGGTQWNLASSIGSDQYKHDFCTSDCDGTPTWNNIGTAGSYETLDTNKAVSATTDFDMRISTPSGSSDYVQKSITITVQAILYVP